MEGKLPEGTPIEQATGSGVLLADRAGDFSHDDETITLPELDGEAPKSEKDERGPTPLHFEFDDLDVSRKAKDPSKSPE